MITDSFGLSLFGGTMSEECEHCSIAAFSPLKAASISSNGMSSTVTGLLLPLIISVALLNNYYTYLSDLLIILMSSSSTSSVGIPSERSIFRNSFIPLISRLHSKSVSFSLVFLLNIKMTSLYLVIPFYKEVCVLSNVWITTCGYLKSPVDYLLI